MTAPAAADRIDDAELERRIRAVPDPEIPVITLDDLGVVREVRFGPDAVEVVLTPTYSGCPAMEAMADAVARVVEAAGRRARLTTRLSPAWTTDWISPRGRAALQRFGIAAPGPAHPAGPTPVRLGRRRVDCPLCGSDDTEELSAFGSTACKALRRCRCCREPFEEFKPL